eukprot:5150271-Pleurochrysis_carterae.AAC.1
MPNTCVPPIHTTAHGTPDWWAAFKRTIMEIRTDVGEQGLDTVMLIAEIDVNAAMNATPSQVDTPIAPIKLMNKHAFEVPQLLHDPGLTTAMRTAQLNFNVVVRARSCVCVFGARRKSRLRNLTTSAATWLRGTCRSMFRLPVPTPVSPSLALRRRTRSR